MECGTLEVPADRDDPDGGEIELAFGIVRSDAPNLAGRPRRLPVGRSGPEHAGAGVAGLRAALRAADGEPRPRAAGPAGHRAERAVTGLRRVHGLGAGLPGLRPARRGAGGRGPRRARGVPRASGRRRRRLRRLQQRGLGCRPGGPADRARLRRVEPVRGLLRHPAGAAGHARSPRRHRSVVLDSAYPADADLYAEMPGNAERAMEALFTTCADDPACAAAYPDLGGTFRGAGRQAERRTGAGHRRGRGERGNGCRTASTATTS